jgi:hypothetical protein
MEEKKCSHEWANSLRQQICMKCGWQPRIDEIVNEALAEQKAKVLVLFECWADHCGCDNCSEFRKKLEAI